MSKPRLEPHDRTRTVSKPAPGHGPGPGPGPGPGRRGMSRAESVGALSNPMLLGFADTAEQRLYTKLVGHHLAPGDQTVEEPAAGPPILIDLDVSTGAGVRIDPDMFLGALANISNLVAILEESTEDDRQLDYLAEIDDYVALLRDELEGAREAGSDVPSGTGGSAMIEIMDIYATVDGAVRAVSATAANLESDLVAVVQGGLPRSLRGDVRGLSQALVSLLSYAVENAEGGEIVLRVTGTEPADGGPVELGFEVYDATMGLPPVPTERLHGGSADGGGPFREEDELADVSVAANAVAGLGGELGVREDPETLGSVLWFSARFEKSTLPPPAEPSFHGTTVLVVEGTESVRDAIRVPLAELGARVLPAEDCDDALGQALLASLAGDAPRVVLVDSGFHGEEVEAFLAELRREPALRGVRVLPIGRVRADLGWEGIEHGEVLRKPILRETVLEIMGRATEGGPR
jgi:CheY-like chemotaxis protein